MKVFFDECVPRPLRKLLAPHEVKTAQEMGWKRLKNGELIRQAETHGFEVFVTADQNLQYQQNLAGGRVAILILSTNYWPVLQKQHTLIASALTAVQPGQYLALAIPTT